MDIPAATIDQIAKGRDGKQVLITADLCKVAADLEAIDERLKLRHSEAGGYFVVYLSIPRPDGSVKESIVTTSQELDERLVKRIEEISSEDYNFSAELERLDKAADREKQHKFDEQVGEIGERLAHAMRTDLGYKNDAGFAANVRFRSGKS